YFLHPKPEHGIPQGVQLPIGTPILLHIPFYFGNPKGTVGFDLAFGFIPLIAVPEFAIDKYSEPVLLDNNIRLSWKLLAMDSETEILCPMSFSQLHFWLCVLPFNVCHGFTTLCRSIKTTRLMKMGYFYRLFVIWKIFAHI